MKIYNTLRGGAYRRKSDHKLYWVRTTIAMDFETIADNTITQRVIGYQISPYYDRKNWENMAFESAIDFEKAFIDVF